MSYAVNRRRGNRVPTREETQRIEVSRKDSRALPPRKRARRDAKYNLKGSVPGFGHEAGRPVARVELSVPPLNEIRGRSESPLRMETPAGLEPIVVDEIAKAKVDGTIEFLLSKGFPLIGTRLCNFSNHDISLEPTIVVDMPKVSETPETGDDEEDFLRFEDASSVVSDLDADALTDMRFSPLVDEIHMPDPDTPKLDEDGADDSTRFEDASSVDSDLEAVSFVNLRSSDVVRVLDGASTPDMNEDAVKNENVDEYSSSVVSELESDGSEYLTDTQSSMDESDDEMTEAEKQDHHGSDVAHANCQADLERLQMDLAAGILQTESVSPGSALGTGEVTEEGHLPNSLESGEYIEEAGENPGNLGNEAVFATAKDAISDGELETLQDDLDNLQACNNDFDLEAVAFACDMYFEDEFPEFDDLDDSEDDGLAILRNAMRPVSFGYRR